MSRHAYLAAAALVAAAGELAISAGRIVGARIVGARIVGAQPPLGATKNAPSHPRHPFALTSPLRAHVTRSSG